MKQKKHEAICQSKATSTLQTQLPPQTQVRLATRLVAGVINYLFQNK